MNCPSIITLGILLVWIATGCVNHAPPKIQRVDELTMDNSQQSQQPSEILQIPDTGVLEKKLIAQGLVNVQAVNPTIKVDLKYAGRDNFLKENVYNDLKRAYLQPRVAQMLSEAQQYVQNVDPNLTLLIFDAARPRSVQVKMWELVANTPDAQYVASPAKGSIHSYGCAVDLGLYHKDTGLVDMGTPFDFFGQLAHPALETQFQESGELTESHIHNRRILRNAMTQAGFRVMPNEWWHFNAFSPEETKSTYRLIE